MTEIIYKELSYEVVNAAIAVWKTLGHGFLEKVYENALCIELTKRSIPYVQQQPIKVHYEGQCVGDYMADIIVDDKIILELEAAKAINDAHVVQVLNYLKATGLRLGLVLNFGVEKMDFKRLIL